MTQPTHGPADEGDERRRHDRRYMVFAIVLAVVVLAFAAISITVVARTTGG